jgi:hypothetical protein
LFWAVSKTIGEEGFLKQLGVAVVECRDCIMSKFGYPNEHAVEMHPLYSHGLAEMKSDVLEVLDSPWVDEVAGRFFQGNWDARAMEYVQTYHFKPRHFVILLKEKTFECLASSLGVAKFCGTFDEAFSHVIAVFNTH